MQHYHSWMKETPEFRLLLLLTHPSPDRQYNAIEKFLSENKINWNEFLKNIKWHRITPQSYDSLKSHTELVPESIIKKLRQSCMECKKTSILQAALLLKIARIFKEHKIKLIAIKGVALSQLLYSDFTMREAHDIDIIVDFNQVEYAEEVLISGLGFTRIIPDISATSKQVKYLNSRLKDRVYQHETDKTILELHWRFNNIKQVLKIPFQLMYETSSCISLHAENINFLSEEDLWLYQCLHGSMSSWYRLHWISDIARMLFIMQPDWNMLLDKSDKYHCRRNLVEAVMLASVLYKLPVPEQIEQVFHCDKKQQLQLKWAKKSLQAGCIHSMMSGFRRHLFFSPTRFFLSYFIDNLRITPTDFKLFPLPDRFFFLYFWLRPIFRIIRIFK